MPRDRAARPDRPKLDPRLLLLLRMKPAEVQELRAHEWGRLEALDARIRVEEQRLRMARHEDAAAASKELRELLQRRFAPITAGFDVGKTGTERILSAFIVADLAAADLEALGARVRTQAGKVATALIPESALPALERCPAVEHIQLGRAMMPNLDQAAPLAGIDGLWQGGAIDGRGTYVGIVDSVLDFHHPDFCDAQGGTRVAWLWDHMIDPEPMTSEASPAAGYGVEYDAAAIDAQLVAFKNGTAGPYAKVRHVPSSDPLVHGTKVAGIAAGGGKANSAYKGAAPGASLIFVAFRILPSGVPADMTRVADGIAYAFEKAGGPCVVNLSNGDNLGAHDGTSPFEQFLDALLDTPGRAITLSAGNSTHTGSHVSGTVTQGQATAVKLNVGFGAQNSFGLEIWYEGNDLFDAAVSFGTAAAVAVPGGGTQTLQVPLMDGTFCNADIHHRLADPNNGDNCLSLWFLIPPGKEMRPGAVNISLTGLTVINGSFHAWVDRNNRGAVGFLAPTEASLTLGVPGTAKRPITVGNHEKQGRVLFSSSGLGPTRDGRVKPEVAATGTNVNTPTASMRTTSSANNYSLLTGTSASAPLVAGACACLFQCRGASLTNDQLKQIFQDTAGTAGIAVPDNGFGFGYVQIATGCSAQPQVDVWLKDANDDSGVEPYAGPVAWLSPDIEVLDRNRQPVANPASLADGAVSTIVRVTVRNRGTSAADAQVFLHWADPATYIPYPAQWRTSGIFTGSGFANPSNAVSIAQIPAGGQAQAEFGWAPPAPGTNIRADDHFCLLVRLENAADPSGVASGGWSIITARNNVALRNVHVLAADTANGNESRFYSVGTGGRDSLRVSTTMHEGELRLTLPLLALPWRTPEIAADARPIFSGKPTRFGTSHVRLTAAEAQRLLNVRGVTEVLIRDPVATIVAQAPAVLSITELRLARDARMPARLWVKPSDGAEPKVWVHVAQRSDGELVGGVSLLLRRA